MKIQWDAVGDAEVRRFDFGFLKIEYYRIDDCWALEVSFFGKRILEHSQRD